MGALFTAIAQGAGRGGNELNEAKNANEDRALKLKQAGLDLQLLQSQLKEAGIQQQAQSAEQLVASYPIKGGKQVNVLRNPLTGQYRGVVADYPAERTKEQASVEDTEDVLGRPMTGKEKETKLGLIPKPSALVGKVEVVNGVPVGIRREGGVKYKSSPDWNEQDEADFAEGMKAYQLGEKNKLQRVRVMMQDRYAAMRDARLDSTAMSLYDKVQDSFEIVKLRDVIANPGRYSSPNPSMKQKSAGVIFDEIDTSLNFLSDAVAKLPNRPLSVGERALLSTILTDPHPFSKWQAYVQSEAASWLEDRPELVEYVTSIVNARESSSALRSLGGQGQAGSDMLRRMINDMLPGAGTPSQAWAQNQMRKVQAEVNALRPQLISVAPTGPAAAQQPAAPGGGGAQLKPPRPSDKGMKWQHRTVNGKVEWRQVPETAQ